MLSNINQTDAGLSYGLAFVGGYGDAASFVLAKTFTGHVTGNLVLAAIAVAAHDWRATLGPLSAIVTFLIGIFLIVSTARPLKAWSAETSHVFLLGLALRTRTVREFAKMVFLVWAVVGLFEVCAYSQTGLGETLSGPDSHETGQGPRGHLFGDWGGERSRLLERGVRFDFQYISDSLWNIKSEQKERFASWNRFRGTVDIDLARWSVDMDYISMRRRSGRAAAIWALILVC